MRRCTLTRTWPWSTYVKDLLKYWHSCKRVVYLLKLLNDVLQSKTVISASCPDLKLCMFLFQYLVQYGNNLASGIQQIYQNISMWKRLWGPGALGHSIFETDYIDGVTECSKYYHDSLQYSIMYTIHPCSCPTLYGFCLRNGPLGNVHNWTSLVCGQLDLNTSLDRSGDFISGSHVTTRICVILAHGYLDSLDHFGVWSPGSHHQRLVPYGVWSAVTQLVRGLRILIVWLDWLAWAAVSYCQGLAVNQLDRSFWCVVTC